MRDRRIERVEEACRRYLMMAAEWVDTDRWSYHESYRYIYHHLEGMAEGLIAAWDFEAYVIARYYADIAERKYFGC